jgi:hypothetical protein
MQFIDNKVENNTCPFIVGLATLLTPSITLTFKNSPILLTYQQKATVCSAGVVFICDAVIT